MVTQGQALPWSNSVQVAVILSLYHLHLWLPGHCNQQKVLECHAYSLKVLAHLLQAGEHTDTGSPMWSQMICILLEQVFFLLQ